MSISNCLLCTTNSYQSAFEFALFSLLILFFAFVIHLKCILMRFLWCLNCQIFTQFFFLIEMIKHQIWKHNLIEMKTEMKLKSEIIFVRFWISGNSIWCLHHSCVINNLLFHWFFLPWNKINKYPNQTKECQNYKMLSCKFVLKINAEIKFLCVVQMQRKNVKRNYIDFIK